MRLSLWWINRIRVHRRALSSVSSPFLSAFSPPPGLLRTLRAAASAWAFRMLLFRSSGVRSGVTHGLLPALFSPHFSVSFTTSSCWGRVRCHRGFITLCRTCVCLCWTASELHRSAAGLHQSKQSLILEEITQTLAWLFMATLTFMLFLGAARSGLLSNSSCFRRAAASELPHKHRKTNQPSYLRFIYIVSKWSSRLRTLMFINSQLWVFFITVLVECNYCWH